MKDQTKHALLEKAAIQLEDQSPAAVLDWAFTHYPKITLACSFGAEDVALVDMIYKLKPQIDIFYLDTDFHFEETYATRDLLMDRYKQARFIQVKPELTPDEQTELHGDKLWQTNPNQCCNIRKVQPLQKVLGKYDAWITGIRRDQAPTRAHAKKVEFDAKFGLVKINPLADWNWEDVWQYIKQNDVIYNPLHDLNYPSIGCFHCTQPVTEGQDLRAGRWVHTQKTECGLHK